MAQLDHIQWRKGIIDSAIFLNSSTEDGKFDNIRTCPELDHTKCKLGKWYYSCAFHFEDNKLYNLVEKPHKELHEIGHNLLNRASEHCEWEEFNELIQALSKKSMEVL